MEFTSTNQKVEFNSTIIYNNTPDEAYLSFEKSFYL